MLRPSEKNERFGVQRMELLAIYFAVADNLAYLRKSIRRVKKKNIVVAIRSDSKSTVEQLQGLSKVRDDLMWRICLSIEKLISTAREKIIFLHLKRSKNIARLLLERETRNWYKRKLEGGFDHSLYCKNFSFPLVKCFQFYGRQFPKFNLERIESIISRRQIVMSQ